MQKVINTGNGRETIDINETVTIFKLTSVLGNREPTATGRVRNRQYIRGSKAIQGQVEVVKPEPRAEPNQDKDQRRSSNHTSGAAAPEETRNEEDRAKTHYVNRPESRRKQAVVATSQQTTEFHSMSEEQTH